MNLKNYTKQIAVISALLLYSLELFPQAPPVTAIGTPTFSAGTWSVPVNVTGFNNVGNISLSLNYNPLDLIYAGVSLNSGLVPGNAVFTPQTDQSGLFKLSYTSATAITLGTPTGILITLSFQVQPGVQGVQSPLTWSTLQGACDMTPPSPGFFVPAITPSNMSTYFLNGFIDIPPGTSKTLNLTLFLEGLYLSPGLMSQARGNAGNQFPGTTADQITVELHSSSPGQYALVLYSVANVNLSTTGQASLTIPSNFSGSYYVTIKHRNSITTVTATPLSFSGTLVTWNFTTAATMAYGSKLKNISGTYVLYAGDVNQDYLVDISDMISVDNLSALATTGYLPSDVNGDGLTDISDMILIDNNSSQAIGASLPF